MTLEVQFRVGANRVILPATSQEWYCVPSSQARKIRPEKAISVAVGNKFATAHDSCNLQRNNERSLLGVILWGFEGGRGGGAS